MYGYVVGTIPFDGTTWERYAHFWINTVGLTEK
jgi:hypothetical protein